jgi:DNA-binding CsgD family transcriptional regulator
MTDQRALSIASGVLVGAGLVFLVLTIFFSSVIDFTLPLIFLTLGPGFVVLVFAWAGRWRFAPLLYVPAGVFTALGVVFLLNVVTGDWNAWAYAWLLPVAGLGLGGLLASNRIVLPGLVGQVSLIIALVGVAAFGVFGAIAGGKFMQIAAPLLLVAGGLGMRLGWFKQLMAGAKPAASGAGQQVGVSAARETQAGGSVTAEALYRGRQTPQAMELSPPVELLSAREHEVLRLIDQGLTNQEIATRLTVAQSTVKTHINNIYGKLQVQTRVQAIKRAKELGYL